MKPVKPVKTEDIGTIKILSEKEEKFINLEVDMSDEVREALLEYADQYMTTKEDQDIRVNWAFVDIIKRHINKMEKTDGKKTKTKTKDKNLITTKA
jgi:hypothetical protein